jgi:small-conductance mechanosensitive channel
MGGTLKPILLALLVLLVFTGLALPAAASHWSHSASLSPASAAQGTDTEFTFTVTNTASGSLDVYFVNVHFCWDPSDIAYYFKEDDGTTVSIPGGASHAFTGFLTVNATTLGSCAWDAQVRGKAVGDLSAYTASYQGSLTVDSQSSIVTLRSGNLLGLVALLGGIVLIIIVVLVLLFILLNRSGASRRPPLQPPAQPQRPPGTSQPPSQPPLAPALTPRSTAPAYCVRCGAPLPPSSAFCAACGAKIQ